MLLINLMIIILMHKTNITKKFIKRINIIIKKLLQQLYLIK